LKKRFKKNCKALFVVHPTTLIKLLWNFISPLTSSKFKKKLIYCATLHDLSQHIDLDILSIPDEVKA
jgi:Rho GTPase-activating protein 1